jgi:hypothetical protein
VSKGKQHTKTEGKNMKASGCVSKAVYSGLQARRRKDTAEYIIHEGKRYEYRSDTQIFSKTCQWHVLNATRLTRIKKAEWLAIKAQQEVK